MKRLTESYFLKMNPYESGQAVLSAQFPIGNVIIHNNTDSDMFIYFGNTPLSMGDQRHDYLIEKYSFATIPLNQKHKSLTIAWTAPSKVFENVRVDLTEEIRPFFIQKNSPITGEDLPKSAGGIATLRWSVGAESIVLSVGDLPHPFRKSLVVKNMSEDKVIYIGSDQSTLSEHGFPISPGESLTFDTFNDTSYYCVSATVDLVDIAIMELF